MFQPPSQGTGSGSGSGAPTDASYLTLGTNSTLSAERVLTAGTGIQFTDGGAGSTLTVTNSGTGAFTLSSDVIRPTDTTDTTVFGPYTGTEHSDWNSSAYKLLLRGESNGGGGTIFACQHAFSDATSQAEFTGYRARGTMASPSAVLDNDNAVRFGAVVYNGSDFLFRGAIDMECYVSGSDYGIELVFRAGTAAATERMRILADGNITATGNISLSAGGGFYASGFTGAGTSGMRIGLPNNTTICSRLTGGTNIDILGLFNDNILYVGDGNLSGGVALWAPKVGFYFTTPISKQTGVAVTAAGIHAALVNLGLISA